MSGGSSRVNKKKSWFSAQGESKGDSTLTGLSSLLCGNWTVFFFLAFSSIFWVFCENHQYLVKTLLFLSGYLKLSLCFAYAGLLVPLFSL